MKFGVREIANVVFRAKAAQKIGNTNFKKGQPVLYIDSAKTSTIEGAATTVYATGGRGNTRLIAWEGEKTLTFTVEDALLSPISFSMLSGAGLIKDKANEAKQVHVHTTTSVQVDSTEIDLTEALNPGEVICSTAPIYVMLTETDGSITGNTVEVKVDAATGTKLIPITEDHKFAESIVGQVVMADYYVIRNTANVSELQIDAENFAGYYYVEADTLFRRQDTGTDMPAILTLPNVKIQSNFTFSMASTGDPSTFTFTMDAMPGYTYFDQTKKVLCVIQIIEEIRANNTTWKTVMGHNENEYLKEDELMGTQDSGKDTASLNPLTLTANTADGKTTISGLPTATGVTFKYKTGAPGYLIIGGDAPTTGWTELTSATEIEDLETGDRIWVVAIKDSKVVGTGSAVV